MPMTETAYTGKDITVLEGLEPVRLRPGMYIGSTGPRGLHHLVYEVVDNAVDEALAGHNDLVEVAIHPDDSITVRDEGRGIPVDLMEEQGLSALTVVLTKLHAGGKFGGEGYKVSGGLHGVGVSVVNALSEWLVAEVHRDGKVHRQAFARGVPQTDVELIGDTTQTGTTISFLPDAEIFEEIEFDGVTLVAAPARDGVPDPRPADRAPRRARRRQDSEEFHYEGGISDFVAHVNAEQGTPSTSTSSTSRARTTTAPSRSRCSGTRAYVESVFSFANNINTTEGGAHLSGFTGGPHRHAQPLRAATRAC